MDRLWRNLIGVLIIAVAVFAGLSIYADLGRTGERLLEIHPGAVAAALALAAGNYAVRFLRWTLYLREVKVDVQPRTSALVFVAGFTMSVTPGKLGELLKAVLLRDHAGAPVSRTAPVVIAERVTDLVALLVLALVGFAAYGIAGTTVAIAAALVGAGLAVIAVRPLAHGLLRLVGRLPRVGRLEPRLREMYDNLAELVRPRGLTVATVLAIVAWLFECVGFAIIVGSLPGAAVPLGLATLIYAATTIAGALSFLPGGLIVTEGGMVTLLVLAARGLDRPAAVAATIVTRLCTLWFAVVLGLLAYAWLRRRARGGVAVSAATRPRRASGPSSDG